MTQYINKSAIVAEIERRIELFTIEKNQEGVSQIDKLSLGGRIAILQELKAFLYTLEVKEVDLEKEVINWWKDYYKDLKDSYTFENYNGHYMNNSTIIKLAQHFFELGLKTQKVK